MNTADIVKALRDLYALDPEWNKICGQAADEIEAMRHDIARHVQVAADQANEIARLEKELAKLRGRG